MFQEEINAVSAMAAKKAALLRSRPLSYFISSALAGMFVGLGILLIFSVGGILSVQDFAGTKIVMGLSFGIALSLVVMAVIVGTTLYSGVEYFIQNWNCLWD